jgi:hypothetical protein
VPQIPSNATLSEQFTKVARSKIPAAKAVTWDASQPLEPSLLVPVALQALVVPQGQNVEHALIGSVLVEGRKHGKDAPDGSPPPFTDAPSGREPGVYLRIALPDGLTRGRAEPGGSLELPSLPDRWLVMRVESAASRKRRMRAWVIQSDHRVVEPLQQFKEGQTKPGQAYIPPEDLTVAIGGDLAWSTIFDSAENRFAIHDDLGQGPKPAGPLTYVVLGWYSKPELDPLHLEASDLSFDERLAELGWTVDEARLEAARADAARERQEAVESFELEARPLAVASVSTEVAIEGGEIEVPSTDVPATLLAEAEQVENKVEPWRPKRTLFEGVCYGISPDGVAREDARPDPEDLTVALGGTSAEALARVAALSLAGDEAAAERLQTGFAYDLADAFDRLDGVPRLEEELHIRGFRSTPTEVVEEQIRTGDPLSEAPGAEEEEATQAGPEEEEEERDGDRERKRPKLDFETRREAEVLDRFARKTRPETFDRPPDPPRTEARPRSGPRRFQPVDPAIVVKGAGRTLLHGYDGELEPDERLACRLTGDPISGYAGLLQGANLLENRIEHGGVPREAQQILDEAVLEDPFTLEDTAALAAELNPSQPAEAVKQRLRGERQLMLRSQKFHSDAPRLTAASIKDGVERSPLGVTMASHPWEPRVLEWKLTVETDGDLARWELGELDLRPRDGEDAKGSESRTIAGRTLLTASAGAALADRVSRFLDEEDRLDRVGRGNVEEGTEDLLRRTATGAQFFDLLGGALDGLREQLLGFDTNLGDFVKDGAEPAPPPPSRAPQLLRGGVATLTRLRIVDAFGRTLELSQAELDKIVLSETLRMPFTAPTVTGTPLFLPPRLLPLSRLKFRFLDAGDDSAEASIDQQSGGRSPIAGFLHPDFVDGSLEFFDAAGAALGQLRHEALSGGVVWESAPGTAPEFGAAPAATIPNPHLAAVATAMVQRDSAERAAGVERSESTLSALLRVTDTTLWSADQTGHAGNEHTAQLVGRPMAVVRAELRLDVERDLDEFGESYPSRAAREDAYADLVSRAFDVRLGALTRFDDGLLGYFVGDDYQRFHPVHPKILEEALPSGPQAGYLAAPGDATGGDPLASQPIDQPWVVADPTVPVRDGERVRLTLLMDPSLAVHATTGILPRKSIALERDWTAEPLSRLAPSFRIGPVLVDPAEVRMPLAFGLPQEQLWSRRADAYSWRDDPILAATKEAALPEASATAQEGFVRARPPGEEEEET